jgi:hypothetical protein
MKTKKRLGIWMDHSIANLMDANYETIVTKTIESEFTHEERERVLSKSEHTMHNDENQKQHAYYKKIGDSIKQYDEVILFGPTHAKEELLNLLKADHHFEKINIKVKSADKMTENQQHAFVKDYFKHVLETN